MGKPKYKYVVVAVTGGDSTYCGQFSSRKKADQEVRKMKSVFRCNKVEGGEVVVRILPRYENWGPAERPLPKRQLPI